MTDWNEDNFLERLLAQARQQGGLERDPCPDAETLCAVLEGEAPALLREQVREHLKHCPNCAALESRLQNFEAGSSPEPEAVWKETRKRLDNWLEGFLRAEDAKLRAAKSAGPSPGGSRWEAFWRPLISRKVVWGMGVAALLVLIADVVLVTELRRHRPPQVQVAARAAVPQKQPANPQPPEKPVEKSHSQGRIERPVGAPLVGALSSQEHPLVGAPLVGARAKPEHALPQVAERLPSNPQPGHAQDAGAPGGQVATPSVPSPQDHNLPSPAAQTTEPPPPNPASEVATAPQPAPGVRKARGGVPTGTLAARSSRSPSSAAPAAPTAATAGQMPTLRLQPGAHLLIALSSFKPLSDGSFQFRGILLLPVVHTGPVLLDRGAEVIGVGTMSQGQTSLAVTEFVVQGARYTLKDGTGAMKAQTPGAGGGVNFERSQVLEMWPVSPSIYEKGPDTTAQPEPQK